MRALGVLLALALTVRAIPDDIHVHGTVPDDIAASPAPPPPMHSMKPASEHEHGHGHGAPLQELNETEVLLHHAPDPLSYWAHDMLGMRLGADGVSIVPASPDDDQRTYGGLMAVHVACMMAAFFAVLPLGIVLRAAKHRYHAIAQTAFLILVTVGWLFSTIYTHLTPDLYPGEKHSSLGYFVLLVVVAIAAYDAFRVLGRIYSFVRNGSTVSPKSFWNRVIRGESDDEKVHADYVPFNEATDVQDEHTHLVEEPEQYATTPEHEFHDVHFQEPASPSRSDGEDLKEDIHQHQHPRRPRFNFKRNSYHSRRESTSSTLRDEPISPDFNFGPDHFARRRFFGQHPHHDKHPVHMDDEDDDEMADIEDEPREEGNRFQRAAATSVYFAEWGLVVFAYILFVSGTAVYSGICRATYSNGCLAHLIKGSIFFLYGVLTFCRYLGAFAAYGWAWNRPPTRGHGANRNSPFPTAEMIECSVIFIYGITNTWLERTGAQAGDPYSTRQIQHISIAVMYWFGGFIGMALESRRIRRLIALSAFRPGSRALKSPSPQDPTGLGVPATYSGSFNPFPALIIGVTGAAMAAHHQTYAYAVQVHMLWGNCLLAFAVFRCMTYVFLWLKPPTAERSVLPSRPPTEALGSLFLACGGLVFCASTEQIEFAAMRNGHDDIMLVLNLVVSIVCIVFSWALLTLAVKGWARSQVQSSHDNASGNILSRDSDVQHHDGSMAIRV